MSKDTDICIISTGHSTFDTRVFEREAVSLANNGYNVSFYTPHDKRETVKNVEIVPLYEPTNIIFRILLSLTVFFQLMKTDYEVYHFHEPDLLPTGIALKYLTGSKIIFDVHEDFEKALMTRQWIPSSFRPIMSKLYSIIEPTFVRRVSAIIVAGDDISTRYSYHDNVVTIGNYPKLSWTDVKIKSTTADSLQLIYIGGISEYRPVIPFFEALRELADERLEIVICGYFSDKKTEKRAKELISEIDQIDFRGWLSSEEEVIQICGESDLGIISVTEDYQNAINAAYRSRKMWEYMATGTPPIVPEFGNWPDAVDDPKCGAVIDVNNKESLKELYEELLHHPDRVDRWKKNSQDKVKKNYNWSTQENKLIGLYEKLIRNH